MIRFSCVVAVMVFVMLSLYAPIMGGCAVCMLAFDCCVWPVVALMLYLDFRDVGGIVQILRIKESSQSGIPMLPVPRKLLMTIKLTQHTSIWKTTYIRPVHAGV